MFESLKERFENGLCTESQLKRFVALGRITQEEFEVIVSGDEGNGEGE